MKKKRISYKRTQYVGNTEAGATPSAVLKHTGVTKRTTGGSVCDQSYAFSVPFQYPIRRPIAKSREVSKPRDWQHCCRDVCPISKRCGNLTHWGRVKHICASKLTIIDSDNGLAPYRRQAIIWNKAGILLIWPLLTNFSEILIANHTFSFKEMHLKISSGKWRPFCLGRNVLNYQSRGFETARDLTIRRLIVFSNGSSVAVNKGYDDVITW